MTFKGNAIFTMQAKIKKKNPQQHNAAVEILLVYMMAAKHTFWMKTCNLQTNYFQQILAPFISETAPVNFALVMQLYSLVAFSAAGFSQGSVMQFDNHIVQIKRLGYERNCRRNPRLP